MATGTRPSTTPPHTKTQINNSRGAREGLPTPLYPCFGMKSGGDRLSLRAGKWFHTPGADRVRRLAV